MGRRIAAHAADTIVIGQYEIDVDVLEQVLSPNNRVLWAFIERDGCVRPVAYTEDRIIWLTDEDLVRKEV
jgi:hypothetical protein